MSESIISSDYCSKLKYIPQLSGTCWFNSILNVMLYSTGMRRVLQNGFNRNLKVIERNKKDKLLTFLLFMLQNYNNIDELEKIYKSFKDFRLKPEYLLFSYLNEYDLNTKKYILSIESDKYNYHGYHTIYISHILNTYNIPYINIIKSKTNNYYLNLKRHSRFQDKIDFINDIIEENSDITYLDNKLKKSDIIFISSGNESLYDFNDINNYNELDTYFLESDESKKNLKEFKKNIHELNEYINIKGYRYKLDSCLISNKNDTVTTYNKLIYHAIAGITCNNNRYAIDSRTKGIIRGVSTDIELKYNIDDSTLKFNKIDWYKTFKDDDNLHIDIKNTSIKSVKIRKDSLFDSLKYTNDLLYNKNDTIIYIYIKVNDSLKSTNIKIPLTDSRDITVNINTKSLIFEKELLSKYNKDIYNLEELSINKLGNIIKDITKIQTIYHDINYYRYIYNFYNKDNKILKQNIDEYNKEELLKSLYITIIKKFLYNGIVINLDNFTDKNMFTTIVNYYNSLDENELFKKLRSYKIPISYDYIKSNIEDIIDLLFKTKYNYFYDIYIERIVSEEEMIKRIIIKLLIHKKYYNETLII